MLLLLSYDDCFIAMLCIEHYTYFFDYLCCADIAMTAERRVALMNY